MPFAEVGGRRHYYELHGEGDPLLCVMGLSADTVAWALQVPAWSAEFRTAIFDNRDVGQSDYVDDDYELEDLAADAFALADVLGWERFHLVGMSLGGTIAQRMALTHPERVRTLTLATTWGGSGRYGKLRAGWWGPLVQRSTREQRVDMMLTLTLSEGWLEQNADWIRELMLKNPHPQDPAGFARQLWAGARHEARAELPSLTMPVHVIGAARDVLVPVWKSEELHELIPGSEYTVIEDSGHAVNVEQAETFNAAVLGFLRAN